MDGVQNNNTALKALENLRMRLLDLTAHNRLINFRHTKRGSLRIIDELPDQLLETLLTEKEMRFLPVPEPTREELIAVGYIEIDVETGQEVRLLKEPIAEEWAKHLGLSTAYEVPTPSTNEPADKYADTAIQTLLYPYELEARLKNLLQTAESAFRKWERISSIWHSVSWSGSTTAMTMRVLQNGVGFNYGMDHVVHTQLGFLHPRNVPCPKRSMPHLLQVEGGPYLPGGSVF